MENREGALPAVATLGDLCCGCGACAAACAKGAIRMTTDEWGFPLPEVDAFLCVGCGLCECSCPALRERQQGSIERVIWARAKDKGLLLASSSGGVFGLLARDVLAAGGVVAGAAWDEDCKAVRHVVVEDLVGLNAVMRSKYVQSEVGQEVYRTVRDALRRGRRALFSGTACQVAGMRGYLGKLAGSDLFLGVDVICHGVPSPGLWRRWVEYVGEREGGRVTGVNMRSKAAGWLSFSAEYKYAAEKDSPECACSTVFNRDWFMRAFLANASLRPSCYACPAKCSSGADVTLGDFWGVKSRHPEAFDDRGVSAALANTFRGLTALEAVLPELEWGESALADVLAGNPSLTGSVMPYAKREAFMAEVASGRPVAEMVDSWTFEPSFARRAARGFKAAAKRLLGRA